MKSADNEDLSSAQDLAARILDGVKALFAAREDLGRTEELHKRVRRTLADVDREFIEGTAANRVPCRACTQPIEAEKIKRTLRRGRRIPMYCDRSECKTFRARLRQQQHRALKDDPALVIPADLEPREWPVYHGLAATSDPDVAECIYSDARRFSRGHLPANLIPDRLRRPFKFAA